MHTYMGHLLASRPNQILAVDCTMLEPSKNRMENVHVMTDVFLKTLRQSQPMTYRLLLWPLPTIQLVTLHNLLCTLPVTKKRDWSCYLPQVTFSYNTIAHQSTGGSPFFLMFGRDPQLPVNFLLVRVQEPVACRTHDWIVEHQTQLRPCF